MVRKVLGVSAFFLLFAIPAQSATFPWLFEGNIQYVDETLYPGVSVGDSFQAYLVWEEVQVSPSGMMGASVTEFCVVVTGTDKLCFSATEATLHNYMRLHDSADPEFIVSLYSDADPIAQMTLYNNPSGEWSLPSGQFWGLNSGAWYDHPDYANPANYDVYGAINAVSLAAISPCVPSVPVPEPSTMILLGSGLLGVASRTRKRKQH